jgi:hypothetical protein
MLLARYKMWLVTLIALVIGVGSAWADDGNETWSPFGPSDVRYDLDLFAPPDLSAYANWPRPNEGFFFQYDRLYMAISGPHRTPIGQGGTALGFFTGPAQFDPTTQNPNLVVTQYSSSVDTGFIKADQVWGNRFELGFMEDDKGWLVSIMNLQKQSQSFTAGSTSAAGGTPAGQTIVFRDPRGLLFGFVDMNGDGFDDDLNLAQFFGGPSGKFPPGTFGVFGRPLPPSNDNLAPVGSITPTSYAGFTDFGDEVKLVPIFNSISAINQTSMVGTEVDRQWRYPTTDYGVWDGFVGIRWLQLRDFFGVTAINDEPTATTAVGLPGTSFWNSTVENNMVGPQIGFRYSHDVARFNILTELRFMAAINLQSTHLNGEIGSALEPLTVNPINVPLQLVRTSFASWKYDETFAPVGELRVGVNYALTKAIGIQAGYNAILGGGISRASRRIDYVLPALQINNTNKNDAFFTDGLNIGITCNR